MPRTVNRPRDDVEAQQLQQGPIDFAEDAAGAQMGDDEMSRDMSEPQSPA